MSKYLSYSFCAHHFNIFLILTLTDIQPDLDIILPVFHNLTEIIIDKKALLLV